ncbi:SDR family oxidoreductase [Peribacillus sp. NPDC006672]|uniref:SDR family oxidoreductase n=1 Tax=Peribacillus sp. NPDC006672 TaxID=3390606 RepID=UPI003D06484E
MEPTHSFTGFPGFIYNQLIRELVKHDEAINKIYLLVLPQQIVKAEAEVASIEDDCNGMEIAFEKVIGDITKEHLDISLDLFDELQHKVTHIFHLAAISI